MQDASQNAYLFHQGTHYRAYEFMGAHLCVQPTEGGGVVFLRQPGAGASKDEPAEPQGVRGVHFCVWAPNAKQVGVVGDFNEWHNPHWLMPASSAGLWAGFIPNLGHGTLYKYAVVSAKGQTTLKADPYAFHGEHSGEMASMVYQMEGFAWRDEPWQKQLVKGAHANNRPMNIYEIHLGSWRRYPDGQCFDYQKMAEEVIPYAKRMGYTHVELLPLCEYPFDGSWGYQVSGYFAATSRFGTPHDLMAFIDAAHRAGIGVFLDWVPAHFPKDAFGLYQFDGQPLYENQSEWRREMGDWGTLQFDFGRPEVQSFLTSSALFWMEKYHIDGLRVDAVASMLYLDYGKKDGKWLPNTNGGNENLDAVALVRKVNQAVHAAFPHALMMAEESTAWPKVTAAVDHGGLGFDFKWNMGWMNDILDYLQTDAFFRKFKHNALTFPLTYAYSEKYILPISHDEVVHGKHSLLDKMPGPYEEKFAGVRAFLGYMLAHPGKKLMFMGAELGQFIEWNYKNELDWLLLQYEYHQKLQAFFEECNHFYLAREELWQLDDSTDGFRWLTCDDCEQNIIAFVRRGKKGRELLCVVNFSPSPRENYGIGVGTPGVYGEVFTSNETRFGGDGTRNGDLTTVKKPMHGCAQHLSMTVPGLTTLFLELKKQN